MNTFWDTSAMVALLLQEPGTAAARSVWKNSSQPWAWRWLVIETESALSRRRATAAAWNQWRSAMGAIRLLDLHPDQWDTLRAFNRGLRRRASDAAHLFVFERASTVIPDLQLVTLDDEMKDGAQQLGLALAG